jgi:hypothetical protein
MSPAGSAQQFGTEPEGMIGGMAGAEHPAIAGYTPDVATNLPGKRLERKSMISSGQGTAQGVVEPTRLLFAQEDADGLIEAPGEQALMTRKREPAARG